jgi:hypothetical protein
MTRRILATAGWILAAAGAGAADRAWMPRTGDHTHQFWAEGFPGAVPDAPWHRVFRTGSFAFVLDTAALRVPHFGPLPEAVGYAGAGLPEDTAWRRLPEAELQLRVRAGDRVFRVGSGGPWTTFGGPRLVESGRFLQRADVTGLTFTAEDGTPGNVEGRFETVAWPDRLGLVFHAGPGRSAVPAGEASFGKIGGGFGLDGTNHLEIAAGPGLEAETFTLELWAFVPDDAASATAAFPWLACHARHEEADGNYGLVLVNGRFQARLNLGGGRENAFQVTAEPAHPLRAEAWNHLAMSYDGDRLRLHVNGEPAGELRIGRARAVGKDPAPLAFGRRQDGSGDGYHFRGVLDEIRLHHRALGDTEIRERFRNPASPGESAPARSWTFDPEGIASEIRPAQEWPGGGLEIRFRSGDQTWTRTWEAPAGQPWKTGEWGEVALLLDPVRGSEAVEAPGLDIRAEDRTTGKALAVVHDASRAWHRIDLDGVEPAPPPGDGTDPGRANDALERVRLELRNPEDREQVARLLFAKSGAGFRQRMGAPITGVSAVLRDVDGQPTGIPVQLSKNWHGRPEGGVHGGTWFHGFSQVRVPPGATVELELVLAYGHWGGLPAASHAQLCLIGWGSNQRWDQSALGAWGESICYEPDQVQGSCSILDVRPVLVRSMSRDQPWGWTHNVGGGDFFRCFDPAGMRMPHRGMRASYRRQGPCLTEVTYAGSIGRGMRHQETVSLARTADVVRGIYRIRLDVTEPVEVSRFVVFQIGADTYSYTGERKFAWGNRSGLTREWEARWGGETLRAGPFEAVGPVPWISLHDASPRRKEDQAGAWANRGVVIREWKARFGGRDAAPWIAERGVRARGADTSTADIVPPPGVTRFLPGDFVDAVIEHVVLPQSAADYYGPDEEFRAALERDGNTWRLVHREAAGNERRVDVSVGRLAGMHPAVEVVAAGNRADFAMAGGVGHVPVTLSGLEASGGFILEIDGKPLDQAVHGNDFWQTDFDPGSGTWSQTYNVAASPSVRRFRFRSAP